MGTLQGFEVLFKGMAAKLTRPRVDSPIDTTVSVLESCCRGDPAVRAEVARVPAINFRQASGGQPNSIVFNETGLVYTGDFLNGSRGVLSTSAVEDAFERQFFFTERSLVARFYRETLPAMQHRLAVAMKHQVALHMDVLAILGRVNPHVCLWKSGPVAFSQSQADDALPPTIVFSAHTCPMQERLKVCKLLVSRTGVKGMLSTAAEQISGRGSSLPDISSPNVLEPLVRSIEISCGRSPDFSNAISTVRVWGECWGVGVGCRCKCAMDTLTRHSVQIVIDVVPGMDAAKRAMSIRKSLQSPPAHPGEP